MYLHRAQQVTLVLGWGCLAACIAILAPEERSHRLNCAKLLEKCLFSTLLSEISVNIKLHTKESTHSFWLSNPLQVNATQFTSGNANATSCNIFYSFHSSRVTKNCSIKYISLIVHVLFLSSFILNCFRIEVWTVAGNPQMVALSQNNHSSEGWLGNYPGSCFFRHMSLELLLIIQQNRIIFYFSNYYPYILLIFLGNYFMSCNQENSCSEMPGSCCYRNSWGNTKKMGRERENWTGSLPFDKCSVNPAFTKQKDKRGRLWSNLYWTIPQITTFSNLFPSPACQHTHKKNPKQT